MNKIKIVVSAFFIICILGGLSGCASNHDKGSLKENLVDGFNKWIQSYSKHVLTKEKDLQGEKDEGVDAYTGTYVAAYDGFNGNELIFGGTALDRENGNQLQVTYKLTIEDGNAELNWIVGNEAYSIANTDSEDTKEYTLSPGNNYIVLKGENFSGSLELTVKDVEEEKKYQKWGAFDTNMDVCIPKNSSEI